MCVCVFTLIFLPLRLFKQLWKNLSKGDIQNNHHDNKQPPRQQKNTTNNELIQFVCQGAFAKLSLCHSAPSEDVERWCVVFVEQVYIWRLKPRHPHQVHHKYSHWEHLYQFCYTFKGCWEIHAIHSSKQSPLAVKSNSPKVSNLRVWCELIKGVEGTIIGLPCLLTPSRSRIRKMWVFTGEITVVFQWANNEQQLKPSKKHQRQYQVI